MIKIFLLFSAINGALAVALGAFGAHGLKGKTSPQLLAAYQTGVHYHMFHVLALFGLSLLLMRIMNTVSELPITLLAAGYCWILGMVMFSGSLYGLGIGGPSWLGPVTPVGGALLIIGWICLVIGITKIPL